MYIAVFMVYALSLIIVGSALRSHFGFPLDDSWIHQTIGRNFARFGSLGYLPHQRSSGSTSLLWTLVLSLNYKLLSNINPVLFALCVNAACLLSTGAMLLYIALQDRMAPFLAFVWAAGPALDGNYVWLTFTGMEHLLFVTLSVACILLWLAPLRDPRGSSWISTIGAGLCMGLLGMTRPEGIVLPAVLIGGSLLTRPLRRHRSSAQTAGAATIFLVLACVPFGVNLFTSHSLLPLTAKGRQWMVVGSAGRRLSSVPTLIEQWLTRPFKAVTLFDGVGLLHHGRLTFVLAGCFLLATTASGVVLLVQSRSWLTLGVCAWGAIHSLLYVFILPTSGVGGRYQTFLLLLPVPLVCLGLAFIFRTSRPLAWAVPALALFTVGAFSLPLWHRVLASGIGHIDTTHGAVATYLGRNLPHETIAAFDIGLIGYERNQSNDPPILDLGGLTDSAYIPYLYTGRVAEYIAEHGVGYIVLPTDPEGQSGIGDMLHLSNNPAVLRQKLFTTCSSSQDWNPGWIETRLAAQCQEVDRVSFNLGQR
jgi:hypothetical protein